MQPIYHLKYFLLPFSIFLGIAGIAVAQTNTGTRTCVVNEVTVAGGYGGTQSKVICIVLQKLFIQSDKSALDLYEGKITWGKFNKIRREQFQVLQAEFNRIINNK